MKKKLGFLYSMKFGVSLLAILIVVCLFGSLIQQGQIESYYLNLFGDAGHLILALGMDDVFHCWWVILLAAFLCVNLVLCSIIRFPVLLKQYKTGYVAERLHKVKPFRIETNASVDAVKKLLGFEKGNYLVKGKAGIWGSWLCHLSLIIIIVGYGAGQVLAVDTSIYGVPGEVKTVQGANEEIEIKINDFNIGLRDDHTVEQYTANLTITLEDGRTTTGISEVNYPLDAFGYRFYQNSTGWANYLSVYKGEETIYEGVLCCGEAYTLEEMPLTILLAQFYPDYTVVDGQPKTLTPYLNNPTSIFALYYDSNLIDMNAVQMEQAIEVDDYVFVFHHPQQYTLIQIMYDPTMSFVLVGAILMLVSLYLCFYVNPNEMWLVEENGKVVVYAYARRGGVLLETTLKAKLKQLEGKK